MKNWNTGYPKIERFASSDLSDLFDEFKTKYGLEPKLINLTINEPDSARTRYEDSQSYMLDDDVYSDDRIYEVDAEVEIDGTKFTFLMEYIWSADERDWFTTDYNVEDLYQRYNHSYMVDNNAITSATSIMAADEDDPFSDMSFEEDGEDVPADDSESVEDSLDDMADTLDELNDALEDIDEDEIDIDVENNIEDHYIAECDKCHGVFITSVVESDQQIEKISGTCPLCDNECDQYIKWVIKEL